MKRSTGLDIVTKKKSRWLRGIEPQVDLPDLDRLFDFYWSGRDRRISMLTVRIIGMNAIAMILLLVGILSLAEYQENLIEAKLESFDSETRLVAEAMGESAIQDGSLNVEHVSLMMARVARTGLPQRLRVFDRSGDLILDSTDINLPKILSSKTKTYAAYSVAHLKDMAASVLELLPERQILPKFPEQNSQKAKDYPDMVEAMNGFINLSAWKGADGFVFLSGAAPLQKDGEIAGTILLTRSARDINDSIGDMWLNIVAAFSITLVMTILVSIYLSGAITAPLRKLSKAADGVRKGKLSVEDIPDFSARNDEIGELSVSFKDMMNALWNRMDSIERFSADVAHELKNPLTSLKSAVETVSIVKKKEDREKLMGIIRHDVDRMDRLITDISHASRLDSALSRDVFELVNVYNVLANLVDAYRDPLDKDQNDTAPVVFEDVTIKFEVYSSGQACIWGLENRLEQVFQNLLGNALSFSKSGDEILISLYQNKNYIRVLFEDQGPGIPDKNLKAIFDRFYTERPTHESYGKHSGLGLSICKQIVTAMGGDIYADNIKNEKGAIKGARFSVILKTT